MANAVNYLSQIQTGQTIQAVHVNQFVDALSGSQAYDLVTSGLIQSLVLYMLLHLGQRMPLMPGRLILLVSLILHQMHQLTPNIL